MDLVPLAQDLEQDVGAPKEKVTEAVDENWALFCLVPVECLVSLFE